VRETLRWYAGTWKVPRARWGDLAAAATFVVSLACLWTTGVEHPDPSVLTLLVGLTVRDAVQPGLTRARRATVVLRGLNALAALLLARAPERIALPDSSTVLALALLVDAALSFRRAWSWVIWAAACLGGAAWLALGQAR